MPGDEEMNIEYPENIQDWFTERTDKEFCMWAFGYENPGSNQKMKKYWESLHPEFPMKDHDTIFICICKMNYLFHAVGKVKVRGDEHKQG